MAGNDCVFVVAEDSELRGALRYMLESSGLDAEEFDDGPDFLKAYDGRHPACLVVDTRVSRLSGFDLLGEVGKRPIPIPVLMLTSLADEPSASRDAAPVVVDVLEMPADHREVLAKIRRCLEMDRRQEQH